MIFPSHESPRRLALSPGEQRQLIAHEPCEPSRAVKNIAAGSRMPSGGGLESTHGRLLELERKPQADLHHAWGPLYLRKVRPIRRRLKVVWFGIRIDGQIAE